MQFIISTCVEYDPNEIPLSVVIDGTNVSQCYYHKLLAINQIRVHQGRDVIHQNRKKTIPANVYASTRQSNLCSPLFKSIITNVLCA